MGVLMSDAASMKNLALSKIPDLIEILMENSREGDIQAARLLAEIAGLSRNSGGRPSTKKPAEEIIPPTPDEIKKRTFDANQILEEYGESNL